MNPYETIVQQLATESSTRLAVAVRKRLEILTDTLSGDDSPLSNVWEEICVQVQNEQSGAWSAYQDVLEQVARQLLKSEPHHVLVAIWLQTDDGIEWSCSEEAEEAAPTWEEDAVVAFIASEILADADSFSNERVRAYLDR